MKKLAIEIILAILMLLTTIVCAIIAIVCFIEYDSSAGAAFIYGAAVSAVILVITLLITLANAENVDNCIDNKIKYDLNSVYAPFSNTEDLVSTKFGPKFVDEAKLRKFVDKFTNYLIESRDDAKKDEEERDAIIYEDIFQIFGSMVELEFGIKVFYNGEEGFYPTTWDKVCEDNKENDDEDT